MQLGLGLLYWVSVVMQANSVQDGLGLLKVMTEVEEFSKESR